jgi:hypothetical protein
VTSPVPVSILTGKLRRSRLEGETGEFEGRRESVNGKGKNKI